MTANYMLVATVGSMEVVAMLFAWVYLASLVFGVKGGAKRALRARGYIALWTVAAVVTTYHFATGIMPAIGLDIDTALLYLLVFLAVVGALAALYSYLTHEDEK